MDGIPSIPAWAKALTEEVFGGPPFAVGDTVAYLDGRMVRIVSGQYWGQRGISNHWSWREVLSDGRLGVLETGYGWQPPATNSVEPHQ